MQTISHVFWLDQPVGVGLLWIKLLDFVSQPVGLGEDSVEVMTKSWLTCLFLPEMEMLVSVIPLVNRWLSHSLDIQQTSLKVTVIRIGWSNPLVNWLAEGTIGLTLQYGKHYNNWMVQTTSLRF